MLTGKRKILTMNDGTTGKFRFVCDWRKQLRLMTPGDGENGAIQGQMKQVRRGEARRVDRKLGNDVLFDELM